MNDEHTYEEKGVVWNRLFTSPQAAASTKIDPFSQQQFMDKTGSVAGKLGDVWDRSAEMSEKRAEKAGGVDPLKEKYYKDYAAKRKGKPHPKQLIEQSKKTTRV